MVRPLLCSLTQFSYEFSCYSLIFSFFSPFIFFLFLQGYASLQKEEEYKRPKESFFFSSNIHLHFSTTQCNSVLYNTLKFYTLHFSTTQCTSVLYSTLQFYTVHFSSIHYTSVLHSVLQYYTVYFSSIQYTSVLYTTLQYYTVHFSSIHYTSVLHSTLQFYTSVHSL